MDQDKLLLQDKGGGTMGALDENLGLGFERNNKDVFHRLSPPPSPGAGTTVNEANVNEANDLRSRLTNLAANTRFSSLFPGRLVPASFGWLCSLSCPSLLECSYELWLGGMLAVYLFIFSNSIGFLRSRGSTEHTRKE